jgi:hypothetical protein
MRDQAVRVELRIPAAIVAQMARVGRETITRFEIDPAAVADAEKRDRIERVYRALRELIERFPLRRPVTSCTTHRAPRARREGATQQR